MLLTRRLMPVAALLLGGVAVALAQTPTTAPTTGPTTGPATAPATQPVAISWDQAGKHVGHTMTVTGPVISTYALEEGKLILNVGKDYPEPDRFSVYLTVPANAPDADATYLNKTVTVTGKIVDERDVPEIAVNAADVVIKK